MTSDRGWDLRVGPVIERLPSVGLIGLILFALLGLGLGFAAPGWTGWLALLAPILFLLITIYSDGLEARLIPLLVISLAVTAAGVLAGKALDLSFSSEAERN